MRRKRLLWHPGPDIQVWIDYGEDGWDYVTITKPFRNRPLVEGRLRRCDQSDADVERYDDRMASFLDRARNVAGVVPGGAQPGDVELGRSHPELCAAFGARLPKEQGGGARFALSVWTGSDGYAVAFRDKQEGLVLWATVHKLKDLWDELEGLLASEETVWRTDRYAGSATASRVKGKAKSPGQAKGKKLR
jgi:hypothetical protein